MEYRVSGGNWGRWRGALVRLIPSGGSDLAELFPTDDNSNLEAGDIVSMNPNNSTFIQKSNQSYDKYVIGIIPTKPAMVIGERSENSQKEVALAGRVPTKVSNENGPIKPGDYITTSSIPGVGMKATKPGPVVGVSLDYFDGEMGMPCEGNPNFVCENIIVFVNRQFYSSNVTINEEGVMEFHNEVEELILSVDKNGNIITIGDIQTPGIKTPEVKTTRISPLGNGKGITIDTLDGQPLKIADESGETVASINNLGQATFKGIKILASSKISKLFETIDQSTEKILASIDSIGNIVGQTITAEEKIISPLAEFEELKADKIETEEINFKNQISKIKTTTQNSKIEITNASDEAIMEINTENKTVTHFGDLLVKKEIRADSNRLITMPLLAELCMPIELSPKRVGLENCWRRI